MKRICKCILVPLLVLCLWACGVETPPETTPTTTTPTTAATTEPTAEPVTEPTTEPTAEPVAADPEWLTDPVEYLPYDTFFREERPLHRIGLSYWNSGQSDTAYYHLDTDENGLYIYCLDNRSEREIVYRVPNSKWFRNSGRINLYYYVSDGRYVYCVRDENEIIRVELLTGEIESLYSGGEILQSFTVCKEGVLYFAARCQENWIFYRLYIPEQKLDVLYDQIPSEIPASSISFGIGETNLAPVEWKMMNPEFYPHLQAVLEDPNNQYVNEWWWMEELRASDDYTTYLSVESSALRLYWNIQEDCGIPYRLKCSYDYVNGIYEEEPEYAAAPTAEPPEDPGAEITLEDSMAYCMPPDEYYLLLYTGQETWLDFDTSECEVGKLYVYVESQDSLWKVADDQVLISAGICHTKDHIYYISELEPTKLYRVEYSGENKTLLYESEYGDISWMDYFGIDPNGVMYMATGGNRVISLDIATGNVETVMEQYDIISFMYYPDYVRDGGEHLGPTFDWIGRPNEGDTPSSYLYRIETGENIHYPRL